MLPMLIAIGAGFAASACSTTPQPTDNSFAPSNGNTDASTTVDDIASTDGSSTTSDSDTSSFSDSASNATTAPNACAHRFPLQGKLSLFAKAPCGDKGTITDIDDTGLGSCTDFQTKHAVFQLNNKGVAQHQTLNSTPDQITQAQYTNIAVTAMDGKTFAYGIFQMYGITAAPSWLPFGSASVDKETVTPSFPKGVAYVSGKLFVATGNMSFATGKAQYFPGSLLVYNDGSITATTLSTQGHNPTSIGTWTDATGTHVAVVNTEALDASGKTAQKSSLAVFNADTLKLEQKIELPFGGLGVAGEIAIGHGKLAIPSADNSGRVVILERDNLTAPAVIVTDPAAQATSGPHMMSFAQIVDRYLVAGNFNTGKISVWDLETTPPTLTGSAIKADETLSDYLGIADLVCYGGKLLVAVGPTIMEIQ